MEKDYKSLLQSLTRSTMLTESCAVLDGMASTAQRLTNGYGWMEVRGNSDYTRDYSISRCAKIMEGVLTGTARAMQPESCLAFQLFSNGEQLSLRIGCQRQHMGLLVSNLRAVYPGIYIRSAVNLCMPEFTVGGILTGYPSYARDDEKEADDLPLDKLLRGLGKTPFCLTVLAMCENTENSVAKTLAWLGKERQDAVSAAERQLGNPNGISQKIIDYEAEACLDVLEKSKELFTYARYSAAWSVEVFYATTNVFTASQLGGMLCATLNGNVNEVVEPAVARSISFINQAYAASYPNIITGNLYLKGQWQDLPLNPNPMATRMSSRELAQLIALPRKEYAGYYVDRFVPFDVDVRPGSEAENSFALGEIVRACQDDAPSEGTYALKLDDLTRHLLVIGLTGGGKTNTSKGLLKTLWLKHHIPFLVIESAKREYWELSMLADDDGSASFPALNVFTLGNENPLTGSPFRLNPMETLPGIALQTHIDYLLSTFKAAFELYPPMPYVLENAVYKVYEDRGWDIVTGTNLFGIDRYPMLEDLKNAVVEITDSLHYDQEVASNVKAALTARIQSLMIGSKYFMMNTPHSIDVEYLLSRPTVLELEDLGDDDTKAFVIGILMVRIYEYRKSTQFQTANRKGGGKALNHVIMIEEAHRLLKNVTIGGEGNQSRANAVEFFCNMLAEIRSLGQGFFISDQVPTKLASDTLKNTNLKIAHRTVMQEDREALGRGMNMTSEQMEFLSALRVGYAAVFGEGDNRPKLVRFPLQLNTSPIDRGTFISSCRERIRRDCKGVFVQGCGTAACHWCADFCVYAEQADGIVAAIGGRGATLELLDGVGGVSAASLLNLFEMFCPQADRAVKLCLAGKLLKWTAEDAANQRAIVEKLVKATAKHL